MQGERTGEKESMRGGILHLNSFEIGVKNVWQEMQMNGDFYDLSLACEDKQIKTHKLVISA